MQVLTKTCLFDGLEMATLNKAIMTKVCGEERLPAESSGAVCKLVPCCLSAVAEMQNIYTLNLQVTVR
jgi:hypothetical protein